MKFLRANIPPEVSLPNSTSARSLSHVLDGDYRQIDLTDWSFHSDRLALATTDERAANRGFDADAAAFGVGLVGADDLVGGARAVFFVLQRDGGSEVDAAGVGLILRVDDRRNLEPLLEELQPAIKYV